MKISNPTLATAGGARGIGDYPRHWGLPQGSALSEERTCWVMYHIARDHGEERRNGRTRAQLERAEVRGHIDLPGFQSQRSRDPHDALRRIALELRT